MRVEVKEKEAKLSEAKVAKEAKDAKEHDAWIVEESWSGCQQARMPFGECRIGSKRTHG